MIYLNNIITLIIYDIFKWYNNILYYKLIIIHKYFVDFDIYKIINHYADFCNKL